jgi:hypothetical protein
MLAWPGGRHESRALVAQDSGRPVLWLQIFCRSPFGCNTNRRAASIALIWPAKPGVLPADCDVMIMAAHPNDGAIVIAKLQRLMFVYRHGRGDAYSGICDECSQCFNSVKIR